MINWLLNTTLTMSVVFSFLVSTQALAQANVRDSSPISSNQAIPAAASPAPAVAEVVAPSSAPTNFAYQIQQLQQEVLELRGMLEEQGFELKRLKQQRLDDYLDLDKRISRLSEGSANSSQNQVTTSNQPSDTTSSILVTPANTGADEKKLYRQAIDKLLSQQDYSGAQTDFSQYLQQYPEGTYAANVHYWQGQIYLTEQKTKEAEQAFSTLVSTYPNHQKTSDGKYKLATIYFDQGKKAEAKQLLDEVANSQTDSARLAKSFLENNF